MKLDYTGLHCPKCGCDQSMIIDTRKGKECKKRRHKCFRCGGVYETVETISKPVSA